MEQKVFADLLFDGKDFHAGGTEIRLRDGVITEVLPLASAPGPEAAPLLDARGKTLMPGIVNAHAHSVRGGMFSPFEPVSLRQISRNLRGMLDAGVTTVGDMGCAPGLILALRRHTEKHPEAGPSILAAGPLITAPSGYPLDWLPSFYARLGIARGCADERSARDAVQAVARQGLDHLKLAIMHRSYADAPLPALREPVARAAVEEAHRCGIRALAHAHALEDYKVALAAGVDALMHSCFEPLDPDTISRIRDQGVRVCPTLWVFESVCLGAEGAWDQRPELTCHVTPAVRREWTRFREAYAASGDVVPPGIAGGLPKARAREAVRIAAANLLLLKDAGVPIAFGNDASYGFCLLARPADEARAMLRAGIAVEECLRAMTSRAAELLGAKDRGLLAPGHRADLLAVDGDLRQGLDCLDRVAAVVHRGKLVPRERQTSQGWGVLLASLRGLGSTLLGALRRPG